MRLRSSSDGAGKDILNELKTVNLGLVKIVGECGADRECARSSLKRGKRYGERRNGGC
jgi:hypothetical protein